MSITKKIIFSLILVIFLCVIGAGVYFIKKFYLTDDGKTMLYKSELGSSLNLQGKEAIKIVKGKFNEDEAEDYIALLGEPKYDDVDSSTINELKKFTSNIELYNNVAIDIIDGNTKESKRYETKKSYGKDVDLEYKVDNNGKYTFIKDNTTGNVALLKFEDGNIKNIITDSFGDEFNGYTIEASFNKEDTTKLNVSLDNYGRDYLSEKTDAYTLDYKDTIVNSENYRLTYMANKFCDFDFTDLDGDGVNELVGIQNILYANKPEFQKNVGTVKSIFKFDENGKLKLNDVVVEK